MRSLSNSLFSVAAVMLVGFDLCCDKEHEVVFTASRSVTFTVNTASSSYSQTIGVDMTDDVRAALSDAEIDPGKVRRIYIESITYTVRQNNSAAGTTADFTVQVGPLGSNPGAAQPFLSGTGVALDQIEDIQQQPALSGLGVAFLNDLLFTAIVEQSGQATFSAFLNGTANPAPPSNLSFVIDATVTFSGIGVQFYDCFLEPEFLNRLSESN